MKRIKLPDNIKYRSSKSKVTSAYDNVPARWLDTLEEIARQNNSLNKLYASMLIKVLTGRHLGYIDPDELTAEQDEAESIVTLYDTLVTKEEIEFLNSIIDWKGELTSKQKRRFKDISSRVRAALCGDEDR
jgi:hypothetical protein